MASIQQSLNQLLGATAGTFTAGSYMIRQSPEFRAKQLDEGAKDVQKQVTNLINDLENIPKEDSIAHKAQTQAITKLAEKRRDLVERAFDTSPTFDRAKKLAGAERGRVIKAERDKMKQEYAEKNAISRLETRSMTARNMLEALKERKDLLSAKERGQLGTMLGRNKEKGGMDE